MKTKFYLITDKKDLVLGIVKATSYDNAFKVFEEKSTLGNEKKLYAQILKPDELHENLNRQLVGTGLMDLR